MHIKFALIFLVAFLAQAKSKIQFWDCGSSFMVGGIYVSGCSTSPCIISRGSQVAVTVVLEKVPELDNMDVEAAIFMYGNKFNVDAKIQNPCIIGCPLTQEITAANFNISISFPASLISRPADLVMTASYLSNGVYRTGLCLGLSVDVI